jgi:hypothetical protein
MSNSKISALTSATTPLAGTETLPVVQSSTTKQVSVSNLTVGRSVLASDFAVDGPAVALSNGMSRVGFGLFLNTITGTYGRFAVNGVEVGNWRTAGIATPGNFIVETSGNGIDFSATPGAGTSELLADYEEGTFTPAVYSGVTSPTYTEQVGRYTKIGIFVFLEIRITFSGGTGSGAQIGINGFPYSSANAKPNGAGYTAYCDATATGITWYMPEAINTNVLGFFAGGTNAILAGALAGKAIILNVTYQSY